MVKDLEKRVSALIFLRLVLVTLLLGSLYIFRIGYDKLPHPDYFSYLIAALYFLTICYALVLRLIRKRYDSEKTDYSHLTLLKWLKVFAYIQIFTDVVAEVILIFITGGIGSMFSFMFLLSIISAAIVLDRRACYIFATLSSILYGVLIDLQFYNVIQMSTHVVFTEKYYFYNIFAHITAFYLIAFLSGYLSEKLHRVTKRLEERDAVLSDLKAFSRYVIESMPSGIFTTDLDNRIISFNSAAQEITGLNLDEVTGRKPEDIFPFLSSFKDPFDRVEGEIKKDSRLFPVGMRLSALKDSSGASIGLIGIFQDLTELKAMEAEVKRKEKWAFIGELSASIAHELRNPLASLKGSIEMLRAKNIPEEQADRLMYIALSEMDRLNGIVTDFLLYARPQDLNKEPYDLNLSLREVVTLLQGAEANKDHVTILSSLDGDQVVRGDARQLKQVFWNLGVNAMDAVSDGGTIDIYTAGNSNAVEVVFKDSGDGISKEDIDNIFYPFFTTKEKGTGLGLSIAQKIIEEHGGKIEVQSEGEGSGAMFKILLPTEG
jgi:two-component system sensor histidine kinase PilS (NtrC family)